MAPAELRKEKGARFSCATAGPPDGGANTGAPAANGARPLSPARGARPQSPSRGASANAPGSPRQLPQQQQQARAASPFVRTRAPAGPSARWDVVRVLSQAGLTHRFGRTALQASACCDFAHLP